VSEVLARAAAAPGGLEEAHRARHHRVRFEMGYAAALVEADDVQRVDELPAVVGIAGHHGRHFVLRGVPAVDALGPWVRQRGLVAQVQAGFFAVPIEGVPLARLYKLPDLVPTAVGIGVVVDQRGQVVTVGVAVLLVAERL
jgi:hypothetical protein